MTIAQIVAGGGLVLALLALAGYYGWRQVQTICGTPASDEDGIFLRRQARWRLVNSGLLLILAVLLFGALVWLEVPAQEVAEQTEQTSSQTWTPEQRDFVRGYTWYWIVLLLVLFAVIFLAGFDYVATRSYRLRQLRQIEEDRRELVREVAARVRRERLESN